jgi:phospholipase C
VTRRRWLTAASCLVAALAAGLSAGLAPSAAPAPAGTPAGTLTGSAAVDHVVVIVEQNHTFDSYFGNMPGVNGLQNARPPLLADGSGERAEFLEYDEVAAQRFRPATGAEPLDNGVEGALGTYRNGAMDGVLIAQQEAGFAPDLAIMMHTRDSVPQLWEMAEDFTLFDNYYSAELGGSLVNMLDLLSGKSDGTFVGTKHSLAKLGASNIPTVFDRLTEAGDSWKYYVGALDQLDPARILDGTYYEPAERTPSALYWAPILAMPRFWTDPTLRSGLADQDQFFRDAASGTLPDVSFILPRPTDHPVSTARLGETRLLSLINAITRSPAWQRTAIFVVWDDWGGMYDHVAPPPGRGFRVPMILVSPWARGGYVSSVQHDHLSVLNFIVQRFGLEPMSDRQAAAASFDDVFLDAPRTDRPIYEIVELPSSKVSGGRVNRLTLGLYSGGLLLTLVLLAGGWRWLGVIERRAARVPVRAEHEQLDEPGARTVHVARWFAGRSAGRDDQFVVQDVEVRAESRE